MFNGQIYYHETIKKIIVAFASLFDNIYVTDSDNTQYRVPINFTTQQKMLLRYKEASKGKQIKLPTMGFILNGQTFDQDRQKNKFNKIYKRGEETGANYSFTYQPTAFNFDFTLSVWAKYMEQFFQIIEQSTVNFKPSINTNIKLLKNTDFEITKDVSVVFNGINYDFNFELNSDTDRVLKADLTFTAKAELYPYINTEQKEIQSIIVDMKDYDTDETFRELVIQ